MDTLCALTPVILILLYCLAPLWELLAGKGVRRSDVEDYEDYREGGYYTFYNHDRDNGGYQ